MGTPTWETEHWVSQLRAILDQNKILPKNTIHSNDEFEKLFFVRYPQLSTYSKEGDERFKEKYVNSAFNFPKSALIELTVRFSDLDPIFSQLHGFLLQDKKSFDYLRGLGSRFEKTAVFDNLAEFFTQISVIEDNQNSAIKVIDDKNGSLASNWRVLSDEFPQIFKLMQALQTLTCSTATLKCSFSNMIDIKTLKRNRIRIENLESSLLIQEECVEESLSLSNQEMKMIYEKFHTLNKPKTQQLDSQIQADSTGKKSDDKNESIKGENRNLNLEKDD
jgi:hypothetical protein